MSKTKILMDFYKKLYDYFGPQNWWPGETKLEIIIGAVLTQNTNWINVEKAIANLKAFDLLSLEKLYNIDHKSLARLIRPAGYFNVKAKRLKQLVKWLMQECDGNLENLQNNDPQVLRESLLSVKGIGAETCDSILLYALDIPTFVVDAYTYRVLLRHNLIPEDATYEQIKQLFEDAIPKDTRLYNEYHALFVKLGKTLCRPKPICKGCPLEEFL